MAPDDLEGKVNMILETIKQNPGWHLRKIKQHMKISMGTAQYHLDRLEKMGRITSTRNGLYRHYFPTGMFKENEQQIIKFLTQETPREIIMFIMEDKNPSQTEIVSRIKISSASISWHIRRLVDASLLLESKDGKFKRYRIHPDINSLYIAKLLQNYYPHTWNKWSNRLAEMFLVMSKSNDIEGKEQD
ncbi:MAG TPA: winged helix-turn-helix transcriptional regulator [Candidatus Nitrosocosmicus sp.]|nr:winged helix-turn-helix transcriptional regulator [Candidatus Nitrosocosmicus sp.]